MTWQPNHTGSNDPVEKRIGRAEGRLGGVSSPRPGRAEAAHLRPEQKPAVVDQLDPVLPGRRLDAHAFRDLDLDLRRRDRGAPYDVHRSSRDLDRAVWIVRGRGVRRS